MTCPAVAVRSATACVRLLLGAVVAIALTAACAARVPVVTAPTYPAFIFPSVPADYDTTPIADGQRDAWAYLQSGDPGTAGTRFTALLTQDAAFYPAAAGLGWVAIADGRPGNALAHFDEALERDATYVAALVGRGEALLRTDDSAGALRAFEAALAVDQSLARVGEMLGELRLRVMTERLAVARDAGEAGRLGEAEAAYREVLAASPDSAFLYLELARLKQRQGAIPEALAEVRRAQALDRQNAEAFFLEGELAESAGDLSVAETAYARADAFEPGDRSASALNRVRAALRVAGLPAPYREIGRRPRVTRGEVAALLGVELAELLRDASAGSATPIFTDTRNHWANQWIVDVARAGVMFDGRSTFEPERSVRRGDLAEIVADTLVLIAEFDPDVGRRWRDERPRLSDMSPEHLNYESASMAVSAGVLDLFDNGRFEPTRSVTGGEVVDVIRRLRRLADGAG